MKFAACYCVYDDFEFLEASVRSIINDIDKIFFFVSFSRYDGTSEEGDNEITLKILENLKKENSDKISIIRDDWKHQLIQRNNAIEHIQSQGFDYCLVIDADEIYNMGEIQILRNFAIRKYNSDVFTTRFYTYFKSLKYRIHPLQKLMALTLIKTNVRLDRTRGVAKDSYKVLNISEDKICWHHISHVRTDERMIKKYKVAMHEYGIKYSWINDVWLKWNTNMRNFHPSHPPAFSGVIYVKKEELPESLWDIYDNEEIYLTGEKWKND